MKTALNSYPFIDEDSRWPSWLAATLERAAAMEQLAPLARRATKRAGRTAKPDSIEPGAVESWYEPNPYRNPVQDGNMLVVGKWFKRQPVAGYLESEAA
ncbi:MAG: hypothetical protein H0X30_05570 [Anaerolineae bacterium]|nr:hypothetical protein [Anaerolineae bacterium]